MRGQQNATRDVDHINAVSAGEMNSLSFSSIHDGPFVSSLHHFFN